jgi:citrate lyase beta subunit
MKNDVLYYSVGALLYCPANKESIADSIIHEKFGNKFSLALCLEDTINDDFVTEAEQTLIESINKIFINYQKQPFYLPKIFIRVRNSEQIERLTKAFKEGIEIITGFIIPKFNSDNATEYINQLIKVNELVSKKIYMMPIYENSSIIDLRNRTDILYSLKESLSPIEELVMNIRVGGNDLCHMFGFRRHSDESIHQIKPISNIFSDIITIYGMDYVVSGPVWEYYAGDNWEKGLIQEIQDDKLCGFTGKTVIHPNQIPIINRAYQVSRNDFNDAQAILNWNRNSNSFVSGSEAKERMNEYKTHINWAQKTVFLAEAYGITD